MRRRVVLHAGTLSAGPASVPAGLTPAGHIVDVSPTVRFLPAGLGTTAVLPGDVGLTHGDAWTSKAIRLGERFRRDVPPGCKRWNHVFCVETAGGGIVEALGRGVVRNRLDRYDGRDYLLVRVAASPADRAQMAAFLASAVQAKSRYGYLNIASIGLNLATGSRLALSIDGEWICSGLASAMLERAGYLLPRTPVHMAPCDVAHLVGGCAPPGKEPR